MTDDEIEVLARRYIAPHYDRLTEVTGVTLPYQQTEQFQRVKGLVQAALAGRVEAHEAGGCAPAIFTPLVDDILPEGWVLYSADFSLAAKGWGAPGSVTLTRDMKGTSTWLKLPTNLQAETPLFVSGRGATLAEALRDAIKRIEK